MTAIEHALNPNRPAATADLIRQVLRNQYAVPTQQVVPLAGGADPQAGSYRADGGRPLVVKVQAVPAAERAVTVAAALSSLGRPELLEPVPTSDGAPYVVIADQAMVVWPFRAGWTGFEQHQTPSVLARVGACLRAVHDLATRTALPVPTDHLDDGRRAEARRWLDRDWTSGDEVQQRLGRLLGRGGNRLRALIEAADQLGRELDPGPTVLCHGDLHAGNVLVGPDGAVTVLDWDTAVLARRERDLMFPGAGVVSTWTDPRQIAAFFAGYGRYEAAGSQDAAIAYFRCERICADVVEYARTVADPADSDRLTAVIQLEQQFQPGDVVDRAERSLGHLTQN